MSTVSVVVPHFGDPRPTLALLKELVEQQPHEIIVCDDASPTPFPAGEDYVVVRRAINGGFGAAVNSAARRASGDLLIIVNSDLDIDETFLKDIVEAVESQLPCIASPQVVEDSAPAYTPRQWPRVRHHTVAWLTPLARLRTTNWWHRLAGHDLEARVSPVAVHTEWLRGACLVIPRASFLALGGFDERFYMNSEEIDLQRRAASLGIPAIYLPTVTVRHTGGGSSAPLRRRGWLTDSWFRYAHKWGGARRLLLSLRVATEINWVWNLQRQLRGKDVQALAVRSAEHAAITHAWRTRDGRST